MEEIWLSRMTKTALPTVKKFCHYANTPINKMFNNTAIADQQDGKME